MKDKHRYICQLLKVIEEALEALAISPGYEEALSSETFTIQEMFRNRRIAIEQLDKTND